MSINIMSLWGNVGNTLVVDGFTCVGCTGGTNCKHRMNINMHAISAMPLLNLQETTTGASVVLECLLSSLLRRVCPLRSLISRQ